MAQPPSFRYFRRSMKKRILSALLGALVAIVSNTYAQQIKIFDTSGDPIANVVVFNSNKSTSALSNLSGLVDLSVFDSIEILLFQHPAYEKLEIRKSEIKDGIVVLEDLIFKMQGVIVSANKWEQDVAEIPNKIVALDDKMVKYYSPQTSADLLSKSGEIFVQKSQLGGGSPKLRGFSANSTLIVVDGVRMNNAIYRSGNLQNVISIDPNSIAGAEVIMGPGSVIYGSDALGGVMDFHTKDPSYSTSEKVTVSGGALARYSTANQEKAGHVDLNLGLKKIALFSSFTHSSFDDLRAGRNRNDDYPEFGSRPFFVSQNSGGLDMLRPNSDPEVQRPSGFDSWQMVQKLSFKPGKTVSFTYGFYFSNTSDIPRYDALTEPLTNSDSLVNAEWYYGPQKWMMHSLRAEIKSQTKIFDQARITAAYQDYEESRNDRGFGADRIRSRTEQVDLYSVNLDFDKGIAKNHSLFYGMEYLSNDVKSTAFRQNIFTGERSSASTRYPDGGSTYNSAAIYGSYIHRLEKLTLSAGMRLTNVSLEATTTNPEASFTNSETIDLNNTAANGSLGLVYKGFENQKLSIMFSSGFRAPNVDDVGKVFELNNNNLIVPNDQLEPEYSYNSEVSWSGSVTNFSWRLTGFYTHLENAIVRGGFSVDGQDTIVVDGTASKVFAQVNAGSAYILGGSLQLNYNLDRHISANLTLTETAGKERTNNEPLRHTTPVFGRFSILYTHPKIRAELFTEFNGARYRPDIPSAEIDGKPYLYAIHSRDRDKDGSPAWATLNLRANYEVTKNLELTVALENLFDLHYRPYSSGISAPGRNFMLALRARL